MKLYEAVDTIFDHNQIVSIWKESPDNNGHIRLWHGMAWDIPQMFKSQSKWYIFGVICDNVYYADAINICVGENIKSKNVNIQKLPDSMDEFKNYEE